MPLVFGGITSGDLVELAPGQVYIIPAGQYWGILSEAHTYQSFDQVSQTWQLCGSGAISKMPLQFWSDGVNFRIANLTGCPIGAVITNAGSAYTSAPTVAVSAGGSQWRAIIGGSINTTVTMTNNGTNYTYPPQVIFSSPAPGGLTATGYATLSGTTVTSVTVTNQGAGYITPPTVTFVNDPREINQLPGWNYTVGYGAAATAALTGANTLTGLMVTDPGSGGLSALPTLTFTGGGGSSAAATVVMCWTITAASITTPGAGLNGTAAWVTAEDNFPTGAVGTNSKYQGGGLIAVRKADITTPISGGHLSGTPVVYDGGVYSSSPIPIVIGNAAVVTTAPVVGFTLGGTVGVSYLVPVGT